MFSKVEGHSNLIRDEKTNAILNTDSMEYNQYIHLKNSKQSQNNKIDSLEDELKQVKDDLNEIKNLLRSLVNGPN